MQREERPINTHSTRCELFNRPNEDTIYVVTAWKHDKHMHALIRMFDQMHVLRLWDLLSHQDIQRNRGDNGDSCKLAVLQSKAKITHISPTNLLIMHGGTEVTISIPLETKINKFR